MFDVKKTPKKEKENCWKNENWIYGMAFLISFELLKFNLQKFFLSFQFV